MAHKFVVGLFQSKGIAEDAVNRLKYEGVPPEYISELLLHETAPIRKNRSICRSARSGSICLSRSRS
jgi:hypothetical protein